MTMPQPKSGMDDASPSKTRRDSLKKIVARLSVEEALNTGQRAELRRLDPRGRLLEPALHYLLARYAPDLPVEDDATMRAWGLLVHVLALAAPDALRPEPLGRALQEAGWKEGRLVNLLDADLDGLADHLPRAVRFLVGKGRRLSADDAADLVFSRLDQSHFEDGEAQADRVRRRIAADYYRAEARSERTVADA